MWSVSQRSYAPRAFVTIFTPGLKQQWFEDPVRVKCKYVSISTVDKHTRWILPVHVINAVYWGACRDEVGRLNWLLFTSWAFFDNQLVLQENSRKLAFAEQGLMYLGLTLWANLKRPGSDNRQDWSEWSLLSRPRKQCWPRPKRRQRLHPQACLGGYRAISSHFSWEGNFEWTVKHLVQGRQPAREEPRELQRDFWQCLGSHPCDDPGQSSPSSSQSLLSSSLRMSLSSSLLLPLPAHPCQWRGGNCWGWSQLEELLVGQVGFELPGHVDNKDDRGVWW